MHATPSPTDPDALLNEVQSADLLNLSVRTLQAWRSAGGGPLFVRAGRAIRYRRRDLLTWIEDSTNTAAGEGPMTTPARKPSGVVSSKNPLIPAYRVRRKDGGISIEFRCPACGRVHSHGLPDPPDDEPVQSRGSHCLGSLAGKNYRLLVVGWRRGHLPVSSAAEIDALNLLIDEVKPCEDMHVDRIAEEFERCRSQELRPPSLRSIARLS
jgi:hypothetical protein